MRLRRKSLNRKVVMIGTVTLNAAIDKRYVIDRFSAGAVNRVKTCMYTAGGKGINVSRVARLAGEQVIATGFVGGHAGEYIVQELEKMDITPFFVQTKGESRSCINLFDRETHRYTELLEPGEEVTEEEQICLLEKVSVMASQCGVIVISGSAPKGTSPRLYSEIIEIAKKKGRKVLLDTSGELLAESLKAGAYLVKPNLDEIAALFRMHPETETEFFRAAEMLRNTGVEIAIISLGKEGAVIACSEGIYRVRVPEVKAVNTVGCGDSMMAGFAVGISRGYGREELIRYASAVSAANAMQEQTGFISMDDVASLLPEITIERIGK